MLYNKLVISNVRLIYDLKEIIVYHSTMWLYVSLNLEKVTSIPVNVKEFESRARKKIFAFKLDA